MKRAPVIATLVVLAAAAAGGRAEAALTQKCKGEKWSEIAASRYGRAELGKLLAIHNRRPTSESCEPGSFVKLPATTRHEVKLGQTLSALLTRFVRAKGAEAVIREHNGIPKQIEPKPGSTLLIPAELELEVGTRPEQELAAIPGLPDLETIKRYNAAGKGALTKGGTIYVPLFLEVVSASQPAPAARPEPGAPPKREPRPEPPAPPPESSETSTSGPNTISFGPSKQTAPLAATLTSAIEARFDAFEHASHAAAMGDGWRCDTCHAADPRRAQTYAPVGEETCKQCHALVEPAGAHVRPRALVLAFSHQLHLDPEGKAAKAGYPADCDVCHLPSTDGRREIPAHPVCIKCHNSGEVRPFVEEQCDGCHGKTEDFDRLAAARELMSKHFTQSVRGDDVRFSHLDHRQTQCESCHEEVRGAGGRADLEPETMGECLDCHQGLERRMVDGAQRLDACRTCHLERTANVQPLFETLVRKPLSHTAFFRRNHDAEARRDDRVCQSCHPQLAGEPAAHCDRCHQQMRPADHGVRWREEPHGRAAERDPSRCATCHEKDRCTDCHAIAPRDHFPRRPFITGHARQARASLARCNACHVPAVDCARCHDVTR